MSYRAFLERKSQIGTRDGFRPTWLPDFLFDFQASLEEWAIETGRSAILADCGMGKTPMELVWAENIVRRTNGRVLVLNPLAVSHQTVREGEKFGVEVHRSQDGKPRPGITVTNYERLHLFDPADFVAVACDECAAADVPYFLKQLGAHIEGDHADFCVQRWFGPGRVFIPPMIGPHTRTRPVGATGFGITDRKGGSIDEWPSDLRIREFPNG